MRLIPAFMIRVIIFAALWVILSGGATSDLPLAVAVVLASAAVSIWLVPPATVRIRFGALVTLIPYFLWQSVLGGWDVARRAFSPALDVRPGTIELSLFLGDASAATLFAWMVSLVPGTASVRLAEGRLIVHVLDVGSPNAARLEALERRVAAIFR